MWSRTCAEQEERKVSLLGRDEEAKGSRTYSVILHANPGSDVVNQLQTGQSSLELAQVDVDLIHILALLGDGLPRCLLHSNLDLLTQLNQSVDLLVVAFDEFGKKAEARG